MREKRPKAVDAVANGGGAACCSTQSQSWTATRPKMQGQRHSPKGAGFDSPGRVSPGYRSPKKSAQPQRGEIREAAIFNRLQQPRTANSRKWSRMVTSSPTPSAEGSLVT